MGVSEGNRARARARARESERQRVRFLFVELLLVLLPRTHRKYPLSLSCLFERVSERVPERGEE